MNRMLLKLAGLAAAVTLGAHLAPVTRAQQAGSTPAPAPSQPAKGLELQRSVAIYNYRTSGDAPVARGEEIYYVKCWYCHNSYTIAQRTGGIPLKGLFTRPKLMTTGQPVSDDTVAAKIRNGSPRMPAYRHSLTDADMADLLAYLRSEKCCFEDEPPPNPWYIGPAKSSRRAQ